MAVREQKRKYHYLKDATGERISVDTMIEGESIHIVPETNGMIAFEHVAKLPFTPGSDAERTIRENTGTLLDGFRQIGSEFDTQEVDTHVIESMRRTPISLADGEYGKDVFPALILCLDLRRFSDYVRDRPPKIVKSFLERYTQELLATINLCDVSYYKLLGDGAMIIWDRPGEKALTNAMKLFGLLRTVVGPLSAEFSFKSNVAGGLALEEVYKYEIYAESSGLKYRDYIGYGINYVFRLQAFAEAGQLLCNKSVPDQYGISPRSLSEERKPDRSSVKGVKDADFADVYVLMEA